MEKVPFRHEPVLLEPVLTWMNTRPNGVYLDGTLGGGGHSEAILRASGGTATLYGIDRDTGGDCGGDRATERLCGLPRDPRQFPRRGGAIGAGRRAQAGWSAGGSGRQLVSVG